MFTAPDFTDPQGVLHELAVCENKTINAYRNESANFRYEFDEGFPDVSASDSTTVSTGLTFELYYWPDQGSYDAGNPPYTLTNDASTNTFFSIPESTLMSPEYDGLTAEEAVEKYCLEVEFVN